MIEMIQEKLSIADWINVTDCPIQRNTERHANKARNKHLKNSSMTHLRVSAAKLPNGELFKLDGHTRAYLWQDGSLIPPGHSVEVDVYLVKNLDQVKELYKQFDSRYAAEDAIDRLFGAFRLYNFQPESALIRAGAITSAIGLCTRKTKENLNIYQTSKPFIPVLRIIDKRMFGYKPFPTGVLAAMLMTVCEHGETAMPFWERYHNDEGYKMGKEKDPVQALTEVVASFRASHKIGTGEGAYKELCGKAISTFLADQAGRTYTCGVKTTDPIKYINEHLEKLNMDLG